MNTDLARDVDEICARPPHHAAPSGNFLPTFRISLSVQSSRVQKSKYYFLDFLAIEDVTDRLSRNVDKKLPLDVA